MPNTILFHFCICTKSHTTMLCKNFCTKTKVFVHFLFFTKISSRLLGQLDIKSLHVSKCAKNAAQVYVEDV